MCEADKAFGLRAWRSAATQYKLAIAELEPAVQHWKGDEGLWERLRLARQGLKDALAADRESVGRSGEASQSGGAAPDPGATRIKCDSCGAVYKIPTVQLTREVNKATCKKCGKAIYVAGPAAPTAPAEPEKIRVATAPAPLPKPVEQPAAALSILKDSAKVGALLGWSRVGEPVSVSCVVTTPEDDLTDVGIAVFEAVSGGRVKDLELSYSHADSGAGQLTYTFVLKRLGVGKFRVRMAFGLRGSSRAPETAEVEVEVRDPSATRKVPARCESCDHGVVIDLAKLPAGGKAIWRCPKCGHSSDARRLESSAPASPARPATPSSAVTGVPGAVAAGSGVEASGVHRDGWLPPAPVASPLQVANAQLRWLLTEGRRFPTLSKPGDPAWYDHLEAVFDARSRGEAATSELEAIAETRDDRADAVALSAQVVLACADAVSGAELPSWLVPEQALEMRQTLNRNLRQPVDVALSRISPLAGAGRRAAAEVGGQPDLLAELDSRLRELGNRLAASRLPQPAPAVPARPKLARRFLRVEHSVGSGQVAGRSVQISGDSASIGSAPGSDILVPGLGRTVGELKVGDSGSFEVEIGGKSPRTLVVPFRRAFWIEGVCLRIFFDPSDSPASRRQVSHGEACEAVDESLVRRAHSVVVGAAIPAEHASQVRAAHSLFGNEPLLFLCYNTANKRANLYIAATADALLWAESGFLSTRCESLPWERVRDVVVADHTHLAVANKRLFCLQPDNVSALVDVLTRLAALLG